MFRNMIQMLLQMSAVTLLYVVLTTFLWLRLGTKKLTFTEKLGLGLIFGLLSVFSTHFGVDYTAMRLNVRDLGPLSAGLFFDPVSGIIAGLIGGVERYIAGTYWGIGSYTRISCSISTILAGFLPLIVRIHEGRTNMSFRMNVFFLACIGAVMEVFHMYTILFTHRDDISMAFYVVKTCSVPMIFFSGVGLAACSISIRKATGEKIGFRKTGEEKASLTNKFHNLLFLYLIIVFTGTSLSAFTVQTQNALQTAEETLTMITGDITKTYNQVQDAREGITLLLEETMSRYLISARNEIEYSNDLESADNALLEDLKTRFELESICIAGPDGKVLKYAGSPIVYASIFSDVLNGTYSQLSVNLSSRRMAAAIRYRDGMIQTVADISHMVQMLSLDELSDIQANFHVGNSGEFNIIAPTGAIIAGNRKNSFMSEKDMAVLMSRPESTFFRANLFHTDFACMTRIISDDLLLLTMLPETEVFEDRNVQAFETAFADILISTVIYILVSILVRILILNNLEKVNHSLDRITSGDLEEKVDVRGSAEFSSLSDDINETVAALKGYIGAAEKRMEEELEFAREIQDSALPKNFDFPSNNIELYALMSPAKEVGGDFYDLFFIDSNRLALVIADVSGKGIPAALFMMRSKTIIRNLAETGITPGEILQKANIMLNEGNDMDMFVTIWIGIIDLQTGFMQCTNAGHEYPILKKKGGDFYVLKDKHSLPLAVIDQLRCYEYVLKFDEGDRLFVYTDGIPEAINEDTTEYGMDRMISKLNEMKDLPLHELLPKMRQDIRDYAGKAQQFDDITMLGFTLCPVKESSESEV